MSARLRKKPAINGESKLILAKTKYEKLVQIFECLDSDKDGRISQDKIETIGLPFGVIEILDPIFEELTQLEEGISQEEFIEAAERLYDVSGPKPLIF